MQLELLNLQPKLYLRSSDSPTAPAILDKIMQNYFI